MGMNPRMSSCHTRVQRFSTNPGTRRGFCAFFCFAVLAFSCLSTVAADYSKWLKNISAAGDPGATYIHDNVKIAVSGNYVHLAWHATKSDWSGNALFYTRSSNGGATFDVPRILATDSSSDFYKVTFAPGFNNLAADGPYVHIVYMVGWPTKLQYLRSADNGASFEAANTLSSGYYGYNAHLASGNGRLAIAWSANGDDSPNPRVINCSYSTDHGATFHTTLLISANGSPYRYNVVDAVRSGNYLYVLAQTQDENWFSTQSRLHLWSSWDGGATFKTPVKVTIPMDGGGDYSTTTQDVHYSPNLFANGLTVNITWLNIDNPGSFDGWIAPTLRTRRSTDGGLTLQDPVTLHTFPEGYQSGSHAGQETITGSGSNLYITDVLGDAPAGTYMWRSTDAGATWKPAQRLSTGGWWPLTKVDPSDSRKIHMVNSSYFQSTNSGISFDGGVNPHTMVANWDAPQMTVDDGGMLHYAAQSGGAYSNEIFYRRIAPPAAPGTTDKVLSCASDSSGTRCDNMQVAASPDLNFTNAMTLEFWARRDSDDTNTGYFEPIVGKKRLSGAGSYELGAWDGSQVFARLVTDKASDSYYGIWVGSGVSMSKGVWYHVALTYDAKLTTNNVKLFVNGALCGKADLQGAILTDLMDSPLQIGNNNNNPGAFSIDELRFWKRALSQDEITTDMEKPLAGGENGLVAYYNFNGTTKDITGRGNDGILMYQERYATPGALLRAKPEITIQQPQGTNLVDGLATRSFGSVTVGKSGTTMSFTVKNTGTRLLAGLAVTKSGANQSNFIVTAPAKTSLAPGAATTFKVTFKPNAAGKRAAVIHVQSNDADENPFDIKLTGTGVL